MKKTAKKISAEAEIVMIFLAYIVGASVIAGLAYHGIFVS